MKVIKNNEKEIIIQDSDYISKMVYHYALKKAEVIEDFFYKNIETHILEAMKLKIENELLDRRLKLRRINH